VAATARSAKTVVSRDLAALLRITGTMTRRSVALLLALTLAAPAVVAPAAAFAQASGTTAPAIPPSGPFGGLPSAPQNSAPAPVQRTSSNTIDNTTSSNTILFIVVGAVIVFGLIVWVIRRDLATAVPGAHRSREDRRIKNPGPKQQPIQQRAERKQRQRAKARKAKQARRANRRG
jgi:hypothetical protein